MRPSSRRLKTPPPHLLAITAIASDLAALREVARQEAWRLESCSSIASALVLLAQDPLRVVFLDRDICTAGWRAALAELLGYRQCRVVLISPVTDDFLWDEVVRLGGFDVITRPLNVTRTISAVNLASGAMQPN
jgi:DNA-binding NtrC family response regulator